MTDTLIILDRPDDLDTKGWNINFKQLLTPKRGKHPYLFLRDELFESADAKFACLFYTIYEYRMGFEAALVGIFENKNKPILLANPQNQWFDYQGDRSLIFSDNFLFLRKLAYNQNDKLSGTPFIVFDLIKKTFAFIDFDATSIYYSPVKVVDHIYKFHLDTSEELKHMTSPNRNGQTFDLTTLTFYSFDKLDKILELYFNEKKNAC
jgi:hypothetical protein